LDEVTDVFSIDDNRVQPEFEALKH
jgi:hypothetical protein